jgi:hypothetical protein
MMGKRKLPKLLLMWLHPNTPSSMAASKDKPNFATLFIPIEQKDYAQFMNDTRFARQQLQQWLKDKPDLLPKAMQTGFAFNGKSRVSQKSTYQLRQIKVGASFYRLQPSWLLPYQRTTTDVASKALLLARFAVPFWAIAYVFGRNAMFWYRLLVSLGRFNLVSTTFLKATNLPSDALTDEHHCRQQGIKAYLATTVAKGCFLGLEASGGADQASLESAYGVFRREARQLAADYAPQSVNCDGWKATQNAWQGLFPGILIIECFFHGFLKIRQRATASLQAHFKQTSDRVWQLYRAEGKRSFAQRFRRFREWASRELPASAMKDNVLKMCAKASLFGRYYERVEAYRVSTSLDRVMRSLTRHVYACGHFHSSLASTTAHVRGFALLYNFTPSSPRVRQKTPGLPSPASRASGQVFSENWLENLLLCASVGNLNHHCNLL